MTTQPGSTGMTGPQPTREQYMDQLSTEQLYSGHQRLHPLGHRNRDEALSEAITRIVNVAPWAKQAPRFVVDTANDALSTGSLDKALIDIRDSESFMATLQHREQLRRSKPETQQRVWDRMDRGAQASLRAQGYRPPNDGQTAGRDPAFGRAQAAETASSTLLGGLGQIAGVGMQLAGKATGNALQLLGGDMLRDDGEWVWDRLIDVQNAPGALWRAGQLTGGLATHPGEVFDGEMWRTAWHGEKAFDPHIARRVADEFDDPSQYRYVARLAGGESVYDIAKDWGAPGSPEYVSGVQQLLDFGENKLVQDGVRALGGALMSPGRHLAAQAGLKPGSKWSTLVSGAGDAAFQWFSDPLMIASATAKAGLAARIGIDMVKGDAANRVLSFFDENLNARAAARGVTDVLAPGYTAALAGMEGTDAERMATMLADHAAQKEWEILRHRLPPSQRAFEEYLKPLASELEGATPQVRAQVHARRKLDYNELLKKNPKQGDFLAHLADYGSEVPIVTPMDIARFYAGEAGLTALVDGSLAHHHYKFTSVPRLTKVGTYKMGLKVAAGEAIDFVANAKVRMLHDPFIAADIGFGDLNLVNGTTMLLSPVARAYQRITTLLPAKGALVFGSREGAEIWGQLLDYGVRGESRRELYNSYIEAGRGIGSEARKRAVVQSGFQTLFANMGLLDDPEFPSHFIDRWLKGSQEKYALDDLDVTRGRRSGIWPMVDDADAVGLPQFGDVLAEVRRQRFMRLMSGFGGPDFAPKAWEKWQPISAMPERFMRVWRPGVLLRPAFAFRAGLEEAIGQFARLGPGHTIKQWIMLPLAATDPALGPLGELALHRGDGLLGYLSDKARLSAGSEASKHADAVVAKLRSIASKFVTPEDIRAYRDHMFVDLVARSYGEISGTRPSLLSAVAGDEPSSFGTITQYKSTGPVEVPVVKVRGSYAEYDSTDELFNLVLGDTAAHVGRDPIARARLKVRSTYLSDGQAQRIGGTLAMESGPIVAPELRRLLAPSQADHPGVWGWLGGTGQGPGMLGYEHGLIDEAGRLKPGVNVTDVIARTDERLAEVRMNLLDEEQRMIRRETEDLLGTGIPDDRTVEQIARNRDQQAADSAKFGVQIGGSDEGLNRLRKYEAELTEFRQAMTRVPTTAAGGYRAAVARARQVVAELPPATHRRLVKWVDSGDVDDLRETLKSLDNDTVRRGGVDLHVETRAMVWDMRLLNKSERQALLVDPSKALPSFGGVTPPQWQGLMDDALAGSRDALNQLEDEVGVMLMQTDDMKPWVQAKDRFDPARFPDLTETERLQQWSVVQRKALDQITLDEGGDIIHGIAARMADQSLDTVKHIIGADHALPPRVHGPELKLVQGRNMTERFVNGFFDWAGDVIRGMARDPLWQEAYAETYRNAKGTLSQFLRDPHLDANAKIVFGDRVDAVSDFFMETEHRMEEAYRSAPSGAKGRTRELRDLSDKELADLLKEHGFGAHDPDPSHMGIIRDWWASERNVREHLALVSAQGATVKATQFIDDHRIRSQAAEMGRNVSPFWFAQEQFYKRWARTFVHTPEALARLSRANQALHAIGWLDTNEHGETVFVYPGSAFANQAVTKVLDLMPGDAKYSLPIAAPLTGQLTHAIPGFDDLAQLPAAGPLLAAPMAFLRQMMPELGIPIENAILPTRAEGRGVMSSIVPTSIKRFWDIVTADEKDLATGVIAAMQLMEATGHGIPENATKGEQQIYFDRLRSHARIIMVTKAFTGLVGPASPAVDLNPGNLDREFQQLLQSGIPIEEALTTYLTKYPDTTAWTLFGSESPSKAPTSPTAAALDSLLHNSEFFDKYRSVGAWLLPQTPPGSDEPFDRAAWREMLANDIRVRKTDEEMWRDLKFAEAAPEFFKRKDQIDALLADTSTPAQRRGINEFWKEWKASYYVTHPVFQEEYESSANHTRRVNTLRDLTQALDDPLAPKVAHAPELREMIDNYASINKLIAESNASAESGTARERAKRREFRQYFDDWATAFVVGHPTVEAFYQRIIVPELGLPPATTKGQG